MNILRNPAEFNQSNFVNNVTEMMLVKKNF